MLVLFIFCMVRVLVVMVLLLLVIWVVKLVSELDIVIERRRVVMVFVLMVIGVNWVCVVWWCVVVDMRKGFFDGEVGN